MKQYTLLSTYTYYKYFEKMGQNRTYGPQILLLIYSMYCFNIINFNRGNIGTITI